MKQYGTNRYSARFFLEKIKELYREEFERNTPSKEAVPSISKSTMYDTLIDHVKAHIDSRKKEGDQILVRGWAFSESRGVCPVRCKYDATIRSVDIESRQDVCDHFKEKRAILSGWKIRVPENKYVDLQIKLGGDWTTLLSFHTLNHKDHTEDPLAPAPTTAPVTDVVSQSGNTVVYPQQTGNLEEMVQHFLQDFVKRNPHVNPATTTVSVINIATNPATASNVYAVDNFYENPDDIRKIALASFANQNTSNFVKEIPTFKKQFEKIMGATIGSFTAYEKNGAFSCTTMHDPAPVQTTKEYQYEGIVFLSPQISSECGLKLYRKTTDTEATDVIGNVYNRLVIYNARLPHLHGPSWGNHAENGRLIQTFAFDLE